MSLRFDVSPPVLPHPAGATVLVPAATLEYLVEFASTGMKLTDFGGEELAHYAAAFEALERAGLR